MVEILSQIQADILDEKVSLSTILRKAKVLAAELSSDELAAWAARELDGYNERSELPDYRIFRTSVFGTYTNGYWLIKNHGLSLFEIKDDWLREQLQTFHILEGVRSVEKYAQMKEGAHFYVRPELLAYVNSQVAERNLGGYGYAELYYTLGSHDFEQILDTVRNRLQDFILKLGKRWNPKNAVPAESIVRNLFNLSIYNNQQGGTMPVFDQRGQHVQFQFNAAGDISLEGLQTLDQLREVIGKLRSEIDRAKQSGALPEDIAVEAQYNLLEASREAASTKPDMSKFMERVSKAKDLLKDIATIGGLATTLAEVVKIAAKLIPC
jgi:hypothetical protein